MLRVDDDDARARGVWVQGRDRVRVAQLDARQHGPLVRVHGEEFHRARLRAVDEEVARERDGRRAHKVLVLADGERLPLRARAGLGLDLVERDARAAEHGGVRLSLIHI